MINKAMFTQIAVVVAVGLLGWVYQAIRPPPPKICGSPGGPPVTSSRVRLSDGRHLAYRERGVPKEKAKYKIIASHGFDSSKDMRLPISQELLEDKGVYFLTFDRAGYGESDPHPNRSVKSEAYDIQELADKLQLGCKFYVIGISRGALPVWSCLKYIPQRLAGASLVVPSVNWWWPSLPSTLADEGFKRRPVQDQWVSRVAHYAPWLLYWFMTQKWSPSLSILQRNMDIFCPKDIEILKKRRETRNIGQEKVRQQGDYESLYRDIMVAYGKWEFDPIMDLKNPFPEHEGSVHIWQGYEDRMVPFQLNRYISEKLRWIQYHEVADFGHLMILDGTMCEAILEALLLH